MEQMSGTESYIYKLTLLRDTQNCKAGQVYIGQHCGKTDNYFTGGKIPKSIRTKYGRDIFAKEIIVSGKFNQELLNSLEVHYIRLYASNIRGLNIREGGKQGWKMSIKVYQYGIDGKFIREFESAEEAAKFLGCVTSGIWASIGKKTICKGFQFRKERVESIESWIRIAKNHYTVYQLDLDGNVFRSFPTSAEAAKANGIKRYSVLKIVRISRNKCGERGIRFSLSPDKLPRIGTVANIFGYKDSGELVKYFEFKRDIEEYVGTPVSMANIRRTVDHPNNGSKKYGLQWKSYMVENCGQHVCSINAKKWRPVEVLDLSTGESTVYRHSMEAAEAVGIPYNSLSQICQGKKPLTKYDHLYKISYQL